MNYDFPSYFEWLIPWEGSAYENDPKDRGGATKYGIDQRSHPGVNIRGLTKETASKIYWDEYWVPMACTKLQPRTSWAIMDCAVNCGRSRATKWIQGIIGVTVDGRFGPVTLSAANKWQDSELAKRILIKREQYYKALGRSVYGARFVKGWLRRNAALQAALGLTKESTTA